MHHSRLCAFVIDCKGDDFASATRFWAGALGRTLAPPEVFCVVNPQRGPLAGQPSVNVWP